MAASRRPSRRRRDGAAGARSRRDRRACGGGCGGSCSPSRPSAAPATSRRSRSGRSSPPRSPGARRSAGCPTAAATIGTAVAATQPVARSCCASGAATGLLGGLAVGVFGAALVLRGGPGRLDPAAAASAAPYRLRQRRLGNLGRYVAADLVPPERRASAIGMVVWGSTIGAVIGPNLVAPAGRDAPVARACRSWRAPYRADRRSSSAWRSRSRSCSCGRSPTRSPIHRPWQRSPTRTCRRPRRVRCCAGPAVAVALVTLVAGQVVMVLIMTMTPIHLIDHGHGLATVGLVLSAHTFGMFALSPISGPADRSVRQPGGHRGRVHRRWPWPRCSRPLAPPDGGILLTLALFLLGCGWNLGFVAGSAMLTRPGAGGADPGPGHRRRPGLGIRRARQPRVRADRGRRRLHGARLLRDCAAGRAEPPPCRPAESPRRAACRGLIRTRGTSQR